MSSELSPADADAPSPDWAVMLRRGARRRCPRCGGGRLFRTFWSIRDRCPRCGLLFAREPGYFTGVYLVNLAVVLTVLFVVVMAFAVWLSGHPDAPLAVPLAVGGVAAVAVPIAFYPFARTIWSALDLAFTPMELEEILDAAVASDDEPDDRCPDPMGPGHGSGGDRRGDESGPGVDDDRPRRPPP